MTIPHNRPTLGEEEEAAASRVLRSGWVAQGDEVRGFENELCAYLGMPDGHAVAVSSGTAALFLALWAVGARSKTVAIPVYSCAAFRNAVAMAGAEEVLVDCAIDSPNMEVEAAASADVAVVAHMFGLPADLPDTIVIEDCAQALGARRGADPVGTQAPIGIFSFYATKLMTSGGQGGMLVAKDEALAEAVRDYREFDYRRDNKVRFNFQMTDLAAAVGREQMKKLPLFLERREAIFQRYREAGLALRDSASGTPVRFRAVLETTEPKAIQQRLADAGIQTIIPIEDWELLGPADRFPNANRLTQESLSLPIFPSLGDADVQAVIGALRTSA